MITCLCPDRESTQALGARLAPTLRAGDVILLSGNIGAGKSEFARGVARGLGIACAVPSPSFTILNVYEEGRVPLYHFDWYRIGDESELTDMGLDEYIGGNGVIYAPLQQQTDRQIGVIGANIGQTGAGRHKGRHSGQTG